MKWTKKNKIKSISQGWMIILDSDSKRYEINRVDDKFMFNSDKDVWLMLLNSNKKLHKKALKFIKKKNLKLYIDNLELIIKYEINLKDFKDYIQSNMNLNDNTIILSRKGEIYNLTKGKLSNSWENLIKNIKIFKNDSTKGDSANRTSTRSIEELF